MFHFYTLLYRGFSNNIRGYGNRTVASNGLMFFNDLVTVNLYKQPFADVLHGVIKIVCNIPRKTPVLESLFNKVAGLKACNFIKKRFQHRRFPTNIAKFLRSSFLKINTGQLLLNLLRSLVYTCQSRAHDLHLIL